MALEYRSDSWNARYRRLAAWSSELTRAMGSDPEFALSHPLIAVLDGRRRAEFLEDLGIRIAAPGPTAPATDRNILQLARALDDHIAWEPFDEEAEASPFAAYALDQLRCVSASDLDHAIANLPVFPAAAQRAIQLLLADTWRAADLQAIAASDQVLAADLIHVANSCAFGARQPVASLGHAIAYIGAERASGILIAASVKRLFAARHLREIWNHSLEASEAARSLAKLSRQVKPDEALLAGLVHDIGRLAMALLPRDFQTRMANLVKQSCELSMIERVLCGLTHAELGARALERWRFPKTFVDAVKFHHTPERSTSPMAALLYLTEQCTNPGEDLPSPVRMKAALERLRLDLEKTQPLDRAGWLLHPLRF